jgi:hypothetical protein
MWLLLVRLGVMHHLDKGSIPTYLPTYLPTFILEHWLALHWILVFVQLFILTSIFPNLRSLIRLFISNTQVWLDSCTQSSRQSYTWSAALGVVEALVLAGTLLGTILVEAGPVDVEEDTEHIELMDGEGKERKGKYLWKRRHRICRPDFRWCWALKGIVMKCIRLSHLWSFCCHCTIS